jgi:hypothetical protein
MTTWSSHLRRHWLAGVVRAVGGNVKGISHILRPKFPCGLSLLAIIAAKRLVAAGLAERACCIVLQDSLQSKAEEAFDSMA